MQCWTDRCCLIFALFELLKQLCHQVQIENLERFSKWCWLDGVLQRPLLESTNKKSIRKYHLKTCLILIKTKESIGIFKNVCSKNSKVVFTSIQFDCFSCWKTKINIANLISMYYADLDHEVTTVSCVTKFSLISAWPITSSFLWNSFCEQLPVICNLMSWVECPRFHQRRIQINVPSMITDILVGNNLPTLLVIIADAINLIEVVWVISN